MLKDLALRAGVTHALDHGSVVHLVREEHATRQLRPERGESSVVRDVAGREDQSSRLAM